MRALTWLLLAATCLSSLEARADVVDPHPGIRVVHGGGMAMVVADLCTAGVSVRATKWDERNRTAASWAQAVDAEVAINADFFDYPGWSFVVGRARGAGEDWPANAQLKEIRSYWQFGVNQAALVPNAATEPGYLITEIVGGHNILIDEGKGLGPLYDGDAVLQGSHRRTAVGLSADRRYLYFFVSNVALNGDGIVWNMATHGAAAGAPPIHWATNMDGGGSSQLYVKGMGSVISSTRPVNNHLGIYAKGAGEPWHCNRAPEGWLDSADASGAKGWAHDVDVPNDPIDVFVSFGGPVFSGAPSKKLKSAKHRDDLCTAIGSCAHGFDVAPPLSLLDGQPHPVHVYGMDEAGVTNVELSGSPKTLQATAPEPTGLRRALGEGGEAAWKLDPIWHRLPASDAAITGLALGPSLPAAPVLVQGDDGAPEVYLLDGTTLRHVSDPSVMDAWSFDWGSIEKRPAAELAGLAKGKAWPTRPVMVTTTSGESFLLDETLPELGPPPFGGAGASGAGGGPSAAAPTEKPGSTTASDDASGCSATSTRPGHAAGLWALLGLLGLGAWRRPSGTDSFRRSLPR